MMQCFGGPCNVWNVLRVENMVEISGHIKIQQFYNPSGCCFLHTHEIVYEQFQNILKLIL